MPMTTAVQGRSRSHCRADLPVPFHRRVWLECQALRGDGYEVSVVCPKGSGDPSMEVLDGVTLYKYRPYQGGGAGAVGFIVEYLVFVRGNRVADREGLAAAAISGLAGL